QPQPQPLPQPQPRSSSLTLVSNHPSVIYGNDITLSGQLSPAVAGSLLIEGADGHGGWVLVCSTTTDATGSYAKTLTPIKSQELRARMADSSATSAGVSQSVTPRLTISKLPPAPAFVGSQLVGRVSPTGWRGKISISVLYAGRVRATVSVRPSANGKVKVKVPTDGVGRLAVIIALPKANDLSAQMVNTSVKATTRSLSQGAHGADVRALMVHMRHLNYHVPGLRSRYDYPVSEVVLAFRKVHGLKRTYSVDQALWRRIARATPERPRYTRPALHIEVNKTRQYLMVVKNGEVQGIIHVSTGATGNTPVGKFKIYQKGSSHLFKFMAFHGNFGIHGYVPVPAFPASHGCVREPMWAAAWTSGQVKIGTRVYVYR
ncbi:MAG: L,D-transpeptidase, partial [Thermoleophilia bacterium]|nr:L,D-transpeptidase [Thermoleophilia bacterium]